MGNLIRLFTVFFLLSILLFQSCTDEKSTPERVEQNEQIQSNEFVYPSVPDTVYFCNIPILIDNFDKRERLDKEIIVNTFYHSSTIQIIKRSNRYLPVLERILSENKIPDDFKYLCIIESALTQVTSPSGAKGFWQFMPQTAREYGLRVDNEVDERLHVEKSTQAACQYLRDAYNKFNDWMLVAASYNMGMSGVEKAMEDQEVDHYFDLHLNNETSRYVFRILALKTILENSSDYGFNMDSIDLYSPVPIKKIKVEHSIKNLKHWARENGTTYHMLKVLNPWIINDKLTIRSEPVTIELPVK